MNTKQVIVMRNDLNMRKGKMVAQGAHAAMMFLTRDLIGEGDLPDVAVEWMNDSFRKICVYVNSEEELLQIYYAAFEAGLVVHLMEDNGATEFDGVKTKTCLAIGPDYDDRINPITGHLKLL
jgi:PTH2 family peptidyl-tRNA hydrolase